jgi:hypothetical protein
MVSSSDWSSDVCSSDLEELTKNDLLPNLTSTSTSTSLLSPPSSAMKNPKKGGGGGPNTPHTNTKNKNSSFVSKLKEDSISKQFTNSLKLLFETLDQTEPHFVRCLKPNAYKQAEHFNARETLLKLKCAGINKYRIIEYVIIIMMLSIYHINNNNNNNLVKKSLIIMFNNKDDLNNKL